MKVRMLRQRPQFLIRRHFLEPCVRSTITFPLHCHQPLTLEVAYVLVGNALVQRGSVSLQLVERSVLKFIWKSGELRIKKSKRLMQ
jgi:hypothetical protein